ncbi:hypothetical protein GQ457_05G017200 [Hibiscus cannabinus]
MYTDSDQAVVDVNFEGRRDQQEIPRNVGRSPSFKDKLMGTQRADEGRPIITELDVEVKEEDVLFGGSSELPEIWFSDRVHDAIDAKLAKSKIVRLLGKLIGYRALWNRINALWNPIGGSWVIYGSYLTVQPWSRHFNSREDHPSHIMVWVRLPKLPYRYYTKSLFKYIATKIGNVVRVDYNTTEGKRGRFARLAIVMDLKKPLISGIIIDGKHQDIEYEGLPSICFKCGKYEHMKEMCGVSEIAMERENNFTEQRNPQELYGPWMQVVNRRRRNVSNVTNRETPGRGVRLVATLGSRYDILADEPETVTEREDAPMSVGMMGDEVEIWIRDLGRKGQMLRKGIELAGLRGALDVEFNRSFNLLVKKQRLDIVVIMEPQISGICRDFLVVFGFCGESLCEWRSLRFRINLCTRFVLRRHMVFGSFVYASPNSVDRRDLLAQLMAVDPGSEYPWVVGGDLNVISKSSERSVGSLRRTWICSRFIEFIFNSALIDMGFFGPKFTWHRGSLFQRLDRCLCNIAWYDTFPDSEVKHLLRLGSDHRPTMLDTVGNTDAKGERPFRYIAAWNDHPELDLPNNISLFQEASCKWSMDVFGHIGKRTAQLLAWLRGIDRAMESSFRSSLVKLEDKLKRELDNVLAQEESLWHQRSRSQFSIQSAYAFLKSEMGNRHENIWRMVWKLKLPNRVRVYAWPAIHERLLTNVERVRRHMAVSDYCDICQNSREDIDHILRKCSATMRVWQWIINPEVSVSFFSLPFHEWLITNLFDPNIISGDEEWPARFIISYCLLWKRRCSFVLNPMSGALNDIIIEGNRLVEDYRRAFGAPVAPCHAHTMEGCWKRPPSEWIKVNVDAAVSLVNSSAGIGVVIRDCDSGWLLGSARFVGRCNVLLAELWAIHDGLTQAWIMAIENGLVASIKQWINKDWQVRVRHVNRDNNVVADKMAAKGHVLDFTTTIFDTTPRDIEALVDGERERSVSVAIFPYDPGGNT